MTTSVSELPRTPNTPSKLVAAEIRAEIARQGLSQRIVTSRLHVSGPWLSRRIGSTADVDLTFEDTVRIAEALNVSVQRLVATWLPRLDSNQQPSG